MNAELTHSDMVSVLNVHDCQMVSRVSEIKIVKLQYFIKTSMKSANDWTNYCCNCSAMSDLQI